jgi:DNA-binding SARP family transcriptional activator
VPDASSAFQAGFAPPTLADGVIDRPRVAAEIVERLSRHGLVQVHGAPGTGKSTAVAQAVASVPGPVAWLTVSEWHREPGRLLDDLGGALAAAMPRLRRAGRRSRSGQSEIVHAAVELASSAARAGGGTLVVDDCHLLADAPDAVAVLGAFARSRDQRLRVALVGREPASLTGIGVEAHHPNAYVGVELLDADLTEATAILRASGSSVDPAEALEATGGWVAGLVFEAWRRPGRDTSDHDPLEIYFSAEFRPRAGAALYEALVDSSVFDDVDALRLTSLGYESASAILSRLRLIGLPATWSDRNASMRLHPRVRELLREELLRAGADRVKAVQMAAAQQLELEGQIERAVDLYATAGAMEKAAPLLDLVIVDIVERGDVALAERLLDEVHPELDDDAGPAPILALLMIRSAQQTSGLRLQRVADHLSHDHDRLRALILAEPRISPFACVAFSGLTRYDEAERLPELTPPGRSADTTRLILSCTVKDDPDAPVPPLLGDALDPLIARALWFKGRLLELRAGMDEHLALAAGIPGFVIAPDPESLDSGSLGARLTQFLDAIERHDLGAAEKATAAVAERPSPLWAALCDAELAVRIARDPERASRAVTRLRELPVSAIPAFRELSQVWEGGALLLGGKDAAAAGALREAATSMRRADRRLELVTALVYLSEAEWRLGNEDAADEASEDAYLVASEQGSRRRLVLGLADFPGVASRRIDAEPEPDGPWHALGRSLAGRASSEAVLSGDPVTVHLRELGEPVIVHRGTEIRTKIRKSIELLSFLVSRPSARATRAEVLTALWNGRDDDSTRAYLRQALRHLREALPEGVTVERRDDVLAVEGAISFETGELEALVSETALHLGERRRGILLEIRGVLTRGVFLAGSEDVVWIDDRRERLRSMLADVRLDLADLALQAESYLEALRFADEALVDDPLLERGWRIRMRTLSLLGDGDGVLGAYRACRDALAEIGLEPSRATTELARTLRS